jgi:hypothetical protein
VQMPRAKASVRTVPGWGERKAAGGVAGRAATPVRPVQVWTGRTLGFVHVHMLGLVLVLGLESLQVVSLLSPSCSIREWDES